MATFDNSYRKCYNKRSDNNKNVISHQTVKFALYGVFAFRDIKSRWTAENAVQRIYIKTGNTKTVKMYAVGGQRKKAYLYIQKRQFVKSLSCGYKMVTVIRVRLTAAAIGAKMVTMEGGASQPPRSWQAVRSWQSVHWKLNSFSLMRYTILGKYAKMAKAGACQKMEKPAVVVEEW